MMKLPAYVENAPNALIELMETDEAVKEFIRQLSIHGGHLKKYVEDLKNKPVESAQVLDFCYQFMCVVLLIYRNSSILINFVVGVVSYLYYNFYCLNFLISKGKVV